MIYRGISIFSYPSQDDSLNASMYAFWKSYFPYIERLIGKGTLLNNSAFVFLDNIVLNIVYLIYEI